MKIFKILVTGGNGFLGSNLVNKISKKNYILHLLIRDKSDISRLKLNKKIKLFKFQKKKFRKFI
jgi:nucleoside-diphosphate-sugar epimerase